MKAKILDGTWAPGHRIPFETELAEHFGVSRMTVNKVLSELTRAGFLERRRKLGTVVCLPRVQSAVLEITDIEREITALGARYSFQLLHREQRKATTADIDRIAVLAGSEILALRCLHCADETPFCMEDRMINLAAVPEAETHDFSNDAPSSFLLAQVPWSTAQHTISAVNADAALAAALDLKPGQACLVVERETELSGVAITHVRLSYPGEKHQMIAQFAPRQG